MAQAHGPLCGSALVPWTLEGYTLPHDFLAKYIGVVGFIVYPSKLKTQNTFLTL